METRITGTPPPKGDARTTVYRVTTAETQEFVIYSKSIFGQIIHWYGGRSHECTREWKACNGCQRSWPEKWLGYVHCFNTHRDEVCFLELTKTACNLLLRQAEPDQPLRGLRVRINKTKGGPKGRYMIATCFPRMREELLREEADPKPVLQFLWNCKNQHSPKV